MIGKLDLNTLHEQAKVGGTASKAANVRRYPKGEDGQLAEIITSLPRGRIVDITSSNRPGVAVGGDNNWFKIYDSISSTSGWMHNSVLDEVGTTVDLVKKSDVKAEADQDTTQLDWDLLDTYDPIRGYKNPLPSWMLYAALAGIVVWMIRE